MLVAGRVSLLRAILYIIFQCLGSIAGTAAIRVFILNKIKCVCQKLLTFCLLFQQTLIDEVYYNGLGHTSLAPNITELQGVGIEFFLGLVLVLTVFGACDANKPGSVEYQLLSHMSQWKYSLNI